MHPPTKNQPLLLSKTQWKKIFVAMSILTICLYIVAMVFSLCGSKYFILNYQNQQMDRIESFLRENKIMALVSWIFTTIEFIIVYTFEAKKFPKWYYILSFYGIAMLIAGFVHVPTIIYQLYPFAFYLLLPIIEQLIESKKVNWKLYIKELLRLLIAIGVTFTLQLMILVIKAGYFDGVNHVQPLSAAFVYAVEYDIALSVILYTIVLLNDKEKGDSEEWTTSHNHGGSSQTSMTQSQPSLQKKLTKIQKNRLRWLYAKTYLIQLGTLLLILVLPFLLGKVFEFVIMYLAFAITRYILGFHYSLHFKKESLCVSASLIIFGILSLAVPFFYVVIIIAIASGCLLAIGLHISYKYKSMWLFNKVVTTDKFAKLYTFFDGNLNKNYVKMICIYHGLDYFQTCLIIDFTQGEKISYMAKCRNYSQRMLIYKLDEAIEKLTA